MNKVSSIMNKIGKTPVLFIGNDTDDLSIATITVASSQLIGSGNDSYTSTSYVRFTPTNEQKAILEDENIIVIKLDLSDLGNTAPAPYIWIKRNTKVLVQSHVAHQFSCGGEQFWYTNYITDIAIKDVGNGALVYVPDFNTCDITLGHISIPDLYADLGRIPTKTSDLTNDSGFITGITSSDVITALGYTPGTSNFSGAYADLTGKPTIPTISGTNDGTNWTSITINSDTYNIPSGGGTGTITDVEVDGVSVVTSGVAEIDLSGLVHKTGNETIGGNKTFTGSTTLGANTTIDLGGNSILFTANNSNSQSLSMILDSGGGSGSEISYDDDNGNHHDLYFPRGSGTIALTSDIPSTSNFVTTNGSGTQIITSDKQFNGNLTILKTGGAPALKLTGDSSGWAGTTILQAGTPGGATRTITLPSNDGTLLTRESAETTYAKRGFEDIVTLEDNITFTNNGASIPIENFEDGNGDFVDGIYFFTYSYSQAFVYLSYDMLTNAYGLPIRASMPVWNSGDTNDHPGSIRIKKDGNYIKVWVTNGTQTQLNSKLVVTRSNLM